MLEKQKTEAEKHKDLYTKSLSSSNEKDFNSLANHYQNKQKVKTEIYYDIMFHLDTIDFLNRHDSFFYRRTNCFRCNENQLSKTCRWFICKCGACGCTKMNYSNRYSRKNSKILLRILQNTILPIKLSDFKKIFNNTALEYFGNDDEVLNFINSKYDPEYKKKQDNIMSKYLEQMGI